ncbi:hypothetical protein [Robiginitalea aurantiaca]|uniref:DegT/DnrJ/EryC1/StrS aminotransferase family protein n=1 Tax=Robiginitalea aurantiaca TaxID=3056915 RepID=A0ABT7WBK4_9FLAO|nr:hypothetical protein [Robiginitalea aurantiaca]MDM9630303.1 hypothetical protein [Robiginitalea aurantiaca]
MNNEIVGYGSFFHEIPLSEVESLPKIEFDAEYELFYSGRNAIKYIFSRIEAYRPIETIWIPYYYCPFVKAWLEHNFNNIEYYTLDSFDHGTEINWSEFRNANDVLIVNNYWGIKTSRIPGGQRPVVIEDHSHGWLSKGCLESTADFCIASLRKTVPLPLGGIAWKPKLSASAIPLGENRNEVGVDDKGMELCWETLAEAMRSKRQCRSVSEKSAYLNLHSKGEAILQIHFDVLPVASDKKGVLENYAFRDYNSVKAKNFKILAPKIDENSFFKILQNGSYTPFGLLLAFKDRDGFQELKKYLISHSIYPAELWPDTVNSGGYKYLMNIHIDLRYSENDMTYIAGCINSWIQQYSQVLH